MTTNIQGKAPAKIQPIKGIQTTVKPLQQPEADGFSEAHRQKMARDKANTDETTRITEKLMNRLNGGAKRGE